MFGLFSQQPSPSYQQVAMSTTPPLAGQSVYGQVMDEILQRYPQRPMPKEGEKRSTADVFEEMLRQNTIQGMIENDPRVQEERSRVYEGTMNRLADAANERAMKGHIFARLINLPKAYQDAMTEKYRFSGPIVDMVKYNTQRTAANPFTSRQYINL